ncbi:MAG: 2-succinyl-5-enolpyruvyl-6-hydroxy-3-cyclohexene-1-carboxylic-acid synthase [Alistipes sp.]|nr:2-succinyl-5-enolpyruvyl-6-hydroxy-3-cyclohexene-1-carboxylic-acid synthase [Candidatus Minthomonas equi]
MYSDRENVNILTSILIGHGIRHIVVCPGSRNSPLVHNFNESPELECHPATDERSAGFIALGITIQTGIPAAVCVTSGSALLNVLPAAAEATLQGQGIIIISADRPSAWTGQLDGQTMEQKNAMGSFTAISVSLPEPHDDTQRWECNRLANEAILSVHSPARPSVHINVPISEPLFRYTTKELPHERIVNSLFWSLDYVRENVCREISESSRPMIIIGQTSDYAIPHEILEELSEKITILTEPLSTSPSSRTPTDAMLARIASHPDEYYPDTVIYMGGNTVSKRLRHFLRSINAFQMTVSPDGVLHDISQHTSLVISGDPGDVIADLNKSLAAPATEEATDFLKLWKTLKERTIKAIDGFTPPFSQMLAVKLLEETAGKNDTYFYANSSAVRLAALYARHHCRCCRGLNGIEGTLSAAVGTALAKTACHDDTPVFCVIGDLSFFYDHNALWQNSLPENLRILLLNNGGGGIFRSLKGLWESPAAENLIAAGHKLSAEWVCRQYGLAYMKANDEKTLRDGLSALRKGQMLLEVITDAETDQNTIENFYGNE